MSYTEQELAKADEVIPRVSLTNYKNDNAKITIYDLLGRPIKTVNILLKENKNYSWVWDGLDMLDQEIPAGIYFLIITIGQKIETQKITFLK